MITEDLIVAQAAHVESFQVVWQTSHVTHGAATDATDVMVLRDIAIESRLGTHRVQPPNNAFEGEDLQVSINRAQADLGKPLAGELVQLCRRRVGRELPQLIEDHLTLTCVSSLETA